MATTNNNNVKEFYTVEDFEAGRKMAELNGAIVEVLEMKATGRVLVKLHGGSMLAVSTLENDLYKTAEKKRRRPEWLRCGVQVTDITDGKTYIIEAVGNQRVQLLHRGGADVRNVLIDCVPDRNQPEVAEWIMPGQKCMHDGFRSEILAVEGCCVKIRKDWGCDTFTETWEDAQTLRHCQTTVTAICQATGDRSEAATFVNDLPVESNMVTLLMQLLGVKNVWDKQLRERYREGVKRGKTGRTWLFELDGYDYIARAY